MQILRMRTTGGETCTVMKKFGSGEINEKGL